MGGMYTKFTYKQLQTMKHALLDYMTRNASDEDFQSEQALLLKINYQIELMKERYEI